MTKQFFLCFTALCVALNTFADDKVVLQLKWEHEFQFAGYYAAQWQGYYQDAGLEVEIRPASTPEGNLVVPIDEMQAGNAQFAVGALDILIGRDKGAELVVLASIFQRSPSAVVTLSPTSAHNLSELSKLRIAVAHGDATKIEIDALFKAQGYDLKNIRYIDAPITIDTLLNNEADAIITYEVSAKMQALERGASLNSKKLADFGIDFYGDTLYTTQQFAQTNPDVVKRFLAASKKGWLYALKHKDEIARQISSELPRHIIQYKDITEYNIRFADIIHTLMQYPSKAIGHVNEDRWFVMNERIRSLGIVHSPLDDSSFFFDTREVRSPWAESLEFFAFAVFLFSMIFVFWYMKNMPVTLLLIVVLSLGIEYQIEKSLKKEKEQEDQLNLLRELSSVSAKLEGNLQTNLSMLTGFAAYISAEPTLTYEDFVNYAKEIFKKEPMLINFAAAKDLIINYMYPLQGNEKAIGLNYREHKEQREMVMQTVNTGQLQVIGPVNLVQGGVAFIGRAPIFTGGGQNRELWGIISAPLDAERLYQRSGINSLSSKVKLAIRRYDSLGNAGPVFYGDESIFTNEKKLQSIITVGGGTWHLAAISNTEHSLTTNIVVVRLVSILTTLIFCFFVLYRFRQAYETQGLEATILSNQKLLEKVGSVAKIGGWKVDSNLDLIQWSEQSSLLLGDYPGFMPDNLENIADRFRKDDFNLWIRSIKMAFKEGKAFDIEVRLRISRGPGIWLRLMANQAIDEDGESYVTGTMQDVTDKVISAKLIERQATYDSLTELPNRVLFYDRLTKSIESGRRNKSKVAVLFIDLDRFKPVNDNHGHQTGDMLLVEAARRIQSCVRESDTVSRLSGDEFGVIINDISGHKDILKITESMLETMQQAFRLKDVSVHCSASIGIAIFPDDASNSEAMVRKSDQAMYEVKDSGRNGWQFYTKEMQEKSEHRHELLNQLIDAIKSKKLMPYFQPITNMKTNKIVKCEALARWQKDDGSFVPPGEFITLAEETGLVNKIDLFMLENAAKQIYKINQNGNDIGLSINVSPRIFHTKDKALYLWLECVKSVSDKIDLTVEITERLLTHDSGKALSVLNKLKEFGVKIAIDDFGTGYSSLSYLIKFPVDIIKIDRAFVMEIGQETSAETLIETVLIMARRLDIEVIAEGIETKEQLEFLQVNQCDFGQGYFLGKPIDKSAFEKLVNHVNLV